MRSPEITSPIILPIILTASALFSRTVISLTKTGKFQIFASFQADEPAIQQVVVQLLIQLLLAGNRVQQLQQQRVNQRLRGQLHAMFAGKRREDFRLFDKETLFAVSATPGNVPAVYSWTLP